FTAGLARFRSAGGGALPADGSETSALLRALVLGERDGAYRELSEPFTRSGLAHVLAISGMHLGVLAGLGALLVRATGHRPRLEALAVIALVLLVLALVPARTPIVRAGVIAIALALGALAGRRHHPIALLAWAGVLILAWRPSELFSPGFQLSFGIVASLLTLVPALERRWCEPLLDPDRRSKGQHAWLWTRRSLLVSFVAWIVSAPLVAHAFGIVAWGSTASAIVSAPLAGIVLALGYAAVIAELIVPGSSGVAGGALLASCEPLLLLVRAMDALPWLHTDTPRLGAWWAGACTLLIVWWCARGRGTPGPERALFYACLVGMTVWTAVEWRAAGPDDDAALRIDTLALGDGACHLVRSGDGAMLVDCGSTWTGAGIRAIPDALRDLGVRRLDAVVVTHPDIDHYACLPDVASRVPVGRVVLGERFVEQARERPDGPAATTLGSLRAMGVRIETVAQGSSWALGGASVEVLAPPRGSTDRADNDQSVVLLLTVETEAGAKRALMTGDIEDDAIARLRASRPGLRADVVEAPHHGA
ncbi:MAG: ComEC/Rec2 family competence protein, partial [Planctomycetota bacterium]